MTPNQIAEAARAKIAGNPELEAEMRAAWEEVKPYMARAAEKFHAVHYAMRNIERNARLAFLTKFVEGGRVRDCYDAAIAAIDLYVKDRTQ